MADIRWSGVDRLSRRGNVHVAGNPVRPDALPRDRRGLRGVIQALPRRRLQLLFRRAGLSVQEGSFQMGTPVEIRRRLGQPSLLLGLSGRDGRRHRDDRRLHDWPGRFSLLGWQPLQRQHSQPDFHVRILHLLRVWSFLYCLPRRGWIHRRRRRHQCHADHRAAHLLLSWRSLTAPTIPRAAPSGY